MDMGCKGLESQVDERSGLRAAKGLASTVQSRMAGGGKCGPEDGDGDACIRWDCRTRGLFDWLRL